MTLTRRQKLTGCGIMALFWMCVVLMGTAGSSWGYSVRFTDSRGTQVELSTPPQRVVSLVPGITRTLFALGVGEKIKGLTWHDIPPIASETPTTASEAPTIVGGFFAPSLEKVRSLEPDVVFASSLHGEIIEGASQTPYRVIVLDTGSIRDIHGNLALLGDMFQRQEDAAALSRKVQGQLDLIARKVQKIPEAQRKRVFRLMGRDRVMTPGDDSFQNDFIRAAGGIPPRLGKTGSVVEVSLEEWTEFNPQVVYGCEEDRTTAETLLTRPGWKDVEAVREGRIFFFPAILACQASLHTGDFVSWLAATLYGEAFSDPSNLVLEEKRTGSRSIVLPLDYVQSAEVVSSTLQDFPNKTLLVRFKEPMRVLSTFEGERTGITTVGNHNIPPPCWPLGHRQGIEAAWNRIFTVLGEDRARGSLLMTGADMDNLSVSKAEHKDITVYALVTAGAESNAIRSASDEGRYYEPGTINILILTNMALSPRAMARAVISATEAKSAALQDLDVRSRGEPLRWQATGTGTDEIIVVEGKGTRLESAGGHSKLGELIARAVYEGVREGLLKQNALGAPRNVLRRLKERGVTPYDLLQRCAVPATLNEHSLRPALELFEETLLDPRYAAFMESALALSDAHERGQIADLEAYASHARRIAEEIAGVEYGRGQWEERVQDKKIPVVLRMALDAVLNGIFQRLEGVPLLDENVAGYEGGRGVDIVDGLDGMDIVDVFQLCSASTGI